ncbi:tlde1 domain-containing protein [Serratia sp. M24T3]|uniref:tlde1 domain-containing protein n=1 Tax=Serratia sp. M24T3 TaxID=932213 RepID=UPI000906E0DD|nr:tlde1 domain-containing protein [Serratia sp. M24T3]
MTWVYQQSTGELTKDGRLIAKGYSGKGAGKNNPALEGTPSIGPLPTGDYSIIGHPFHHPHTGIFSMRLFPNPRNRMFGRSGFLIHGDSVKHPGSASDGCIILPLPVRQRLWSSGDRSIEVVK